MTVLLLWITVLGVGVSITADDDSYFDISTHQTTNLATDFLTLGPGSNATPTSGRARVRLTWATSYSARTTRSSWLSRKR